jgi:hypothetical protein
MKMKRAVKNKLKLTGYVKLRRGLTEHLARMTSGEVKLFVAYLLQADYYIEGSEKRCLLSHSKLAEVCGWTVKWVRVVRDRLTKRGFIKQITPHKSGIKIPKFEQEIRNDSSASEAKNRNDSSPKSHITNHKSKDYGSSKNLIIENNKSKNQEEDYSYDPLKHKKGPGWRKLKEEIRKLGKKHD